MEEEIMGFSVEHDIKKLQGLAIKVDKISREELKKEGMLCKFAEARMYNIKTTGVQGDDASYRYTTEINIKKLKHSDGTKYKEKEFYEFLSRLSSRVTNEIGEINRVVYVTITKQDRKPFFF